MEKILLALLLGIFTLSKGFAHDCEARDPEPEKEEFWPADMVPHPNPPWHRPKKPGPPID